MRRGGYTLRMYGHSSTGVLGLSQDLRRARILRRIEEHKKNKENTEEEEDLERKGISRLLKLTHDLKRNHMKKVDM